jgi:HD-GYP domain-containing protein (c-di-GMP phosphodiesterase class II)
VVVALSDALDLVGVEDMAHGKRVGIMGACFARALGMAERDVGFMFDVGMLHDIGVSSTRAHRHLADTFDMPDFQQHCLIGHALLSEFAPLATMALPVRYHHTPWDELQTLGLEPAVAMQANIVHLADRVDALATKSKAEGHILRRSDAIRAKIATLSGTRFAPALVDAFMRESQAESFWLQLDPRGIEAALVFRLEEQLPYRASMDELRQLALIFSRIVDAKSRFTSEHSSGVGSLARYLGERMGVSTENCQKMEIAGLLHDIGKLRIPDEILEKPGPLDPEEAAIMRTHSYETYLILQTIRGFEEINQWAASHHEQPNHGGYPFRVDGNTLPLEARILRVADIFQALAQARPYRPGMDSAAVQEILQRMAREKSLDPKVVEVVFSDLPAALRAALPADTAVQG